MSRSAIVPRRFRRDAFRSRKPRRARQTDHGFTLIELVVTVTLIALVTSVALPAFASLGGEPAATTLEPARALLLQARRTAERAGMPVAVSIVPNSGRYRVEVRARDQEGWQITEGVLGPIGIDREGDDRFSVVFRPVGIGVGDTLVGRDGRLVVEPLSGEIEILR